MAEEENNNVEETPEAVEPEAAEETPAEEAGASDEVAEDTAEPAATPEPEPDGPAAEGEEPADVSAAEEEAEPAATPEPEPDGPAAEGEEPAEVLSPKAARKRGRSIHTGEVKPQRTPEERAAERDALRKANAASRRRRRASVRAKRGEPGQGTPPAERVPGHQEGAARDRGLRQGRQDDHGPGGPRAAPSPVREGRASVIDGARSRRAQRGRRGRHRARDRVPAASPGPSAGAWSRSSRRRR